MTKIGPAVQALILCSASHLIAMPASAARPSVDLRPPVAHELVPDEGPALTREALRACVRSYHEIEAAQGEIDRLEAQLVSTENAIRLVEATLSRARADGDTSAEGIEAQIARRADLVASYNQQLPSLNAYVNAQDVEIDAFNGACAQKSYRASELNKMRSEI